MSRYSEALTEAMTWLGGQTNIAFIGQALRGGTFQSHTLDEVPNEKLLEFPVQESFNIQFAIGAALSGLTIVAIIPRINFLLIAFGDIVNLLDKLPEMTNGQVKPHLIIRTAIGPDKPDPKVQHTGDYSDAFLESLEGTKTTRINNEWINNSGVRLFRPATPEEVLGAYQIAYNTKEASLIIEDGRKYNE